MLVTLIELRNDPPFCEFGGLVDTPPEITPEDMPRLYTKWCSESEVGNTDDDFCPWLCKNHGCSEVNCGFAILEDSEEEESEE